MELSSTTLVEHKTELHSFCEDDSRHSDTILEPYVSVKLVHLKFGPAVMLS